MGRWRRWLKAVGLPLCWVVVTAALLEGAVAALVELGWLRTPRPPYRGGVFWEGDDPRFGAWHRPSTRFRHRTACFDAVYESNAVGARDRDRQRDSAARRVVVLGDSFAEGWGLPAEQRISNLLEAATGVEHLNFAMAHFGPYQEYLSYRDLARSYRHDAVLLAILPINDFFDLDYDMARVAGWYHYRYRPYLLGTYPNYRTFFWREPALRRWARRYTYTFQAVQEAMPVRPRGDPPPPDPDLVGSNYYEFTDRQLDLLRFSIESLVREARPHPVVVLLLPSYADLVRHLESGPNPLAPRLEAALAGQARVVDLLPPLYQHTPDWQDYYFTCDYHWTALANRVAAEHVARELQGSLYPAPGR
jgi:acetyltransferase AlgX (SGNH hydrolase-like protein)